MVVAEDIKAFVPILVAVGDGEVGRKQVDERLAAVRTEIPPQPDLAAVAVVLRDLLRPGIDDDRQRNAAACQQIRQLAHVLKRPFDSALDPEWAESGEVGVGKRPANSLLVMLDGPPAVAEPGLDPALERDADPVRDDEMVDE